ncbi:uncharacterized protein PV09_02037 [Verruconis gallopava]|uniref:DJ-1/PfpI domain-containing protein n=1 Tax=Verruconis gallopava TaxID=253628 RepID=A0A0D2AJY1_9PEZI|nr:uncharacterized protein PV09_02037 [Verruconis gallopava]KIW07168.1 hypothetical protein PV09_02037 [Verruconis gallopava]
MSAIADDGPTKPIEVLFVAHDGFDTLDLLGPLEVFSQAKHDGGKDVKGMKAFNTTIAAPTQGVKTAQDVTIKADIDLDDALEDLNDYDILVIPGGSTEPFTGDGGEKKQPIPLIKAWADLQRNDPSKERTLFSVCTGSLLLAKAGVLQGLAATTHPDHYTRLEMLCQEASVKDTGIRTDVMEERYVVNNARFDLGEKPEDNPFITSRKPDARRPSIIQGRKGSESFKQAKRRESLLKRANMPLGGLRVITAGGITCGIDAALYLVAALVSVESAHEVARVTQYNWQKGVTVEGIDV